MAAGLERAERALAELEAALALEEEEGDVRALVLVEHQVDTRRKQKLLLCQLRVLQQLLGVIENPGLPPAPPDLRGAALEAQQRWQELKARYREALGVLEEAMPPALAQLDRGQQLLQRGRAALRARREQQEELEVKLREAKERRDKLLVEVQQRRLQKLARQEALLRLREEAERDPRAAPGAPAGTTPQFPAPPAAVPQPWRGGPAAGAPPAAAPPAGPGAAGAAAALPRGAEPVPGGGTLEGQVRPGLAAGVGGPAGPWGSPGGSDTVDAAGGAGVPRKWGGAAAGPPRGDTPHPRAPRPPHADAVAGAAGGGLRPRGDPNPQIMLTTDWGSPAPNKPHPKKSFYTPKNPFTPRKKPFYTPKKPFYTPKKPLTLQKNSFTPQMNSLPPPISSSASPQTFKRDFRGGCGSSFIVGRGLGVWGFWGSGFGVWGSLWGRVGAGPLGLVALGVQ